MICTFSGAGGCGFPPDEDTLPACMLPEQDLQFEGGPVTPAEGRGDFLTSVWRQKRGEGTCLRIRLGFLAVVQHLLHPDQKLRQAVEVFHLLPSVEKPALQNTIVIGIHTEQILPAFLYPGLRDHRQHLLLCSGTIIQDADFKVCYISVLVKYFYRDRKKIPLKNRQKKNDNSFFLCYTGTKKRTGGAL